MQKNMPLQLVCPNNPPHSIHTHFPPPIIVISIYSLLLYNRYLSRFYYSEPWFPIYQSTNAARLPKEVF